jgi:hypothetical protein
VIDVRVRQKDVQNLQVVIADRPEEPVDLVARVDQDAFTCPFATDDEPVLVEGCFRADFEDHSLQSYS